MFKLNAYIGIKSGNEMGSRDLVGVCESEAVVIELDKCGDCILDGADDFWEGGGWR